MQLNEGLLSGQLHMKLQVLENAVTQLIEMHSKLYGEVELLKRKVDLLSRKGPSETSQQSRENEDSEMDLDISQVQKILKQQQSGPSTLGRRA